MPTVYNVAVIGTGFAEAVQLPGFQRHPRFQIAALAARDPQRTRKAAQKCGIDRWYTDWRQMIDEGGFDVLSVTTPPHLHKGMTLAGFDAGTHVLCEKPMALNATEAHQMLDRARETGLTAMIDHEFRHLAARERFGELINEGYIGELRRLVIRFYRSGRADRSRTWNWWSDFDRGGGLLGAIGSHYFDAVRHWFSREPVRVWGKLNVFVEERSLPDGTGSRAVTADDSLLVVLDLDDGAEALFDFTTTAPAGTGSWVTALGSEGTLIIEDDRRLLGTGNRGDLRPLDLELLPRERDEPWLVAPFLRLLDDLAAGIDEGTSPSPNFADGLAHQQFIDAVKISDARDGWIDYPASADVAKDVLPQ